MVAPLKSGAARRSGACAGFTTGLLSMAAIAVVLALGPSEAPANGTPPTALHASPSDQAADVTTAVDQPVLDVQPLAAAERRVIEVPPRAIVELEDATFDPAVATYVASGDDLIVTTANGGVLVLVGFFAITNQPASLSVLAAPPATAEELLTRAEEVQLPDEDVAAAGPVSGGGELAGIASVIQWLLSRVDLGGSAEAAEIDDPPLVEAVPLLAQVLAQLRIASAGERLQLVREHEARLAPLLDSVRQLEDQGRGDFLDVRAVEVAVIEGKLALEDAALEYDLAVNHHLDDFGYRLLTASFPKWPSDPPTSMEEMGAEVAQTHYVEARRQLRHLR